MSNDCPLREPVLGYRFGGKRSQEWVDEKIAEYRDLGWRRVETVGELAFASPDGRWLHTFESETGRAMFIDAEWISKMNMVKSSEKEAVNEE